MYAVSCVASRQRRISGSNWALVSHSRCETGTAKRAACGLFPRWNFLAADEGRSHSSFGEAGLWSSSPMLKLETSAKMLYLQRVRNAIEWAHQRVGKAHDEGGHSATTVWPKDVEDGGHVHYLHGHSLSMYDTLDPDVQRHETRWIQISRRRSPHAVAINSYSCNPASLHPITLLARRGVEKAIRRNGRINIGNIR